MCICKLQTTASTDCAAFNHFSFFVQFECTTHTHAHTHRGRKRARESETVRTQKCQSVNMHGEWKKVQSLKCMTTTQTHLLRPNTLGNSACTHTLLFDIGYALVKITKKYWKNTILMSLLVLLLIATLRPICMSRKLNWTENWSAGIVYDVMNRMTSCLLLAPIHHTRDFNNWKILEKSIQNKCLLWSAGTFSFLSPIEEFVWMKIFLIIDTFIVTLFLLALMWNSKFKHDEREHCKIQIVAAAAFFIIQSRRNDHKSIW